MMSFLGSYKPKTDDSSKQAKSQKAQPEEGEVWKKNKTT